MLPALVGPYTSLWPIYALDASVAPAAAIKAIAPKIIFPLFIASKLFFKKL